VSVSTDAMKDRCEVLPDDDGILIGYKSRFGLGWARGGERTKQDGGGRWKLGRTMRNELVPTQVEPFQHIFRMQVDTVFVAQPSSLAGV
jgi:hypothetical protein